MMIGHDSGTEPCSACHRHLSTAMCVASNSSEWFRPSFVLPRTACEAQARNFDIRSGNRKKKPKRLRSPPVSCE